MRTKITTVLAILLVNITIGQDLNIKFLEQIAGVSFWSIDDVMEDGYGFTKINKDSNSLERRYVKGNPNDLKTVLVIKILNTKTSAHTLDIMVGKNYNLQNFKSDLLDEGYLYNGSNDYGFLVYKKDKQGILLEKESVPKDFYQIVMVSE